jgi:hypothetical protein
MTVLILANWKFAGWQSPIEGAMIISREMLKTWSEKSPA